VRLRRRRKGNSVPGGITGPPFNWGRKYRDLIFQVGVRRKDRRLFFVKRIVVKSKEVKTGWSTSQHIAGNRQTWQNFLRRAMVRKGLFF
jgi:hypothetical protein